MSFTVNAKSDLWSSKTEIAKRSGQAVWQVVSTTPTTPAAAEAACVAAGFGAISSIYPGEATGSTFRCTGRECKPQGQSRTIFRVTADYDNVISYNANPLDDPIAYDYDGESRDESYFKDTNEDDPGYAETTAGEPFDELPKRETDTVVINFSRNVASTATYSTYFPFCNKVNDGGVTIDGLSFTDGQVKTGVLKLSSVQNRDGYAYKVLSGTVKARPDGWDDKFESRGLFEWVDSLGILLPIVDSQGNTTDVVWPLDENGAAKDSINDTGAEIKLEPYKRTDLSSLFATGG